MTKLKLHWQILIAMMLGIGIGIYFHGTEFNSNKLYSLIASFGIIFVRLLKMIIVPLIFTSIITGVASIKDSSRLGRLGVKTLLYYTMTSLFAIIIGLTLTNLIQPGIDFDESLKKPYDSSNLDKDNSPAEILIRMVPENPFNAASDGDMLGIIFFAIFLGISISRLSDQHQSTLSNFFEAMFQAVMKMTETIIKLAPIGVLGLITKTVSTSGLGLLVNLAKYMNR